MATTLCPECGKPAHSGGPGSFECSGGLGEATRWSEHTVADASGPTPTEDRATQAGVGVQTKITPAGSRGSALPKGTLVGEYRIEQVIGEGGMGTVYRAVQPIIGKRVAVKVLGGTLARDKNAIERFVLEARSVNEIGHRNLIDIFSFGQLTDGRYYYVMEYLEGKSLGAILRARKRLHPDEAFPIFRDVARALEAAHGKGIIHRDLKPDNVILVPDGDGTTRAKLLDFGLAKLVERKGPGGPKTDVGLTLGTPQYMSPEQCVGANVDARSDIYALGVMLFQTVCGRVPFNGATLVDIWQAQVRGRPPRPSQLVPDAITLELEALILRMLSKDPLDRFQTAGDVYTALAGLVAAGRLSVGGRLTAARAVVASSGDAKGDNGAASHTPSFDLIPIDRFDDVKVAGVDGREAPTSVELPHPIATPSPAETLVVTPRPVKVVADLRSALGLTIAEPAFDNAVPSQISALDIDLSAPTPRGATPIALPIAPAQERRHLPALAPPVPRAPAPEAEAGRARAARRRKVAVALALALGAAAAAAFVLF